MSTVRLVPSDDEQAWLRGALAELCRLAGWQRLVTAHLVEPSELWFPDRWTRDAFGVRRLALRLLRYAGLDDLDVTVEIFAGEHEVELDAHGVQKQSRHRGAAAWFAGIEGEVCIFGAELSQIEDPLGIVAAMAHECAHAFRRRHGLEVEDRDEEERLTDLTTIYLGFGLLTTNATSRHRSSGDMYTLQWSHRALGYLPPQAMSWLLATWCRARSLRAGEPSRIASTLEANQAGYFRAALDRLGEPDAVREELGIPGRDAWPQPIAIDELLSPLDEGDWAKAEEAAQTEATTTRTVGMNAGRPVFRVRRTRAIQLAAVGGLAGFVVALALASSVGGAAFLASPALAAAGLALGRGLPVDVCSDPACAHALTAGATQCPGCGGVVSGEIGHANERLEAEERLLGRTEADRSDES